MRLFLLPVSSRRTLLYCERLEPTGRHATASANMMDKATARAAKMWTEWEHKPPGSWQHRVVSSGNAGLRRIAFEEWGLKSVPPLSSRVRAEAAAAAAAKQDGNETRSAAVVPAAVQVVYPSSIIADKDVVGVLRRLSTEREALHRKRLIWCFVGMPISAPFGLVPVVPNIPFFYLAFRAWSHWRALAGGRHVQHLLEHNQLVYQPSPALDAIYATTAPTKSETSDSETETKTDTDTDTDTEAEEKLLLTHPEGSKAVADALETPSLELELERAIWQVETALAKEKAAKQQQISAPSDKTAPEKEK